MKEKFVSYEIARLAKKHKFNKECFAWYNYNQLNYFGEDNILDGYANEIDERPVAPTYQQLSDWFREKYRLHITINPISNDGLKFIYKWSILVPLRESKIEFKTFYEAFDNAIEEAFKIIHNKDY